MDALGDARARADLAMPVDERLARDQRALLGEDARSEAAESLATLPAAQLDAEARHMDREIQLLVRDEQSVFGSAQV
ncbi:hypothetical protein D3C83_164590 [compost metagenome]